MTSVVVIVSLPCPKAAVKEEFALGWSLPLASLSHDMA